MLAKVVLITRDTIEDKTSRVEVEAQEIKLISSDLHGSTADALIGGEWQRVFKDHREGPYCKWYKETVVE